MKIVALIPIKFHNQRLPGKNIKPLGGKPLISYIQETLKKVKGIDDIYVYCSDERIKPYLLDGVKYLKRSEELDKDSTKINEVLKSFACDVSADYYLLTHATAPFISAESIQSGVDAVLNGKADSALSVERLYDFLWKDGVPMNYDPANIPRTQDLDPIYKETCGYYIYSRYLILNENRRVGKNPALIEVSEIEAVDINNADDFELADAIYSSKAKTMN